MGVSSLEPITSNSSENDKFMHEKNILFLNGFRGIPALFVFESFIILSKPAVFMENPLILE